MPVFPRIQKPLIALGLFLFTIGLFVGQGLGFEALAALGTIGFVWSIGLACVRDAKPTAPGMLFILLYLTGQAIAYTCDLPFLKSYERTPDGNGASYSLVSVVFPVLLAWVVSKVYKRIGKA
ncbi:hypothetical protein WMW72_28345 [Paenibacillus filicis]|uniref:Permease n=1 Tax=Paenibacillus filicis TaxID=669464 RepID=A0ABU9DSI0_9BACL